MWVAPSHILRSQSEQEGESGKANWLIALSTLCFMVSCDDVSNPWPWPSAEAGPTVTAFWWDEQHPLPVCTQSSWLAGYLFTAANTLVNTVTQLSHHIKLTFSWFNICLAYAWLSKPLYPLQRFESKSQLPRFCCYCLLYQCFFWRNVPWELLLLS